MSYGGAGLIGYVFSGSVPSASLPTEANQDWTEVKSDLCRCVVTDGLGESGARAGDWARMLGQAFARSTENTPSNSGNGEWLQDARERWLRDSVALSAAPVLRLEEKRALEKGVNACLAGVAFQHLTDGTFVAWTAVGDVNIFLLRKGELLRSAPLSSSEEFCSSPDSLNSNGGEGVDILTGQWGPLQEGDTVALASDALSCFLLQGWESEDSSGSFLQDLSDVKDWEVFAELIWSWRSEGKPLVLENDDVSFIRIKVAQRNRCRSFRMTRDIRAHSGRAVLETSSDAEYSEDRKHGRRPHEPALETERREEPSSINSAMGYGSGLLPRFANIALGSLSTLALVWFFWAAPLARERSVPLRDDTVEVLDERQKARQHVAEKGNTVVPVDHGSTSSHRVDALESPNGRKESTLLLSASPNCPLTRGTKLFSQRIDDRWPLVVIEAGQVECNEVESDDSVSTVSFSVWAGVSAQERAGGGLWFFNGRVPAPLNVWSGPVGTKGAEYVGNLKEGTYFEIDKIFEHGGHIWLRMTIKGLRIIAVEEDGLATRSVTR